MIRVKNSMKYIYSFALVGVLAGCSGTSKSVDLPDLNASSGMQNVKSEDFSQEKEHKIGLIHYIKKVDGTKIEFWIDPLEDDVDFDYTFSKVDNTQSAEQFDKEKSGTNKADSAKKDKTKEQLQNQETADENKSDIKDKVDSYSIEDYLANYENAQALYYAKEYSKALISVKKAISSNPEVAQGYKLEGTILYTLNRYDEALDAWKKALELNPTLEDVKASIANLESNVK